MAGLQRALLFLVILSGGRRGDRSRRTPTADFACSAPRIVLSSRECSSSRQLLVIPRMFCHPDNYLSSRAESRDLLFVWSGRSADGLFGAVLVGVNPGHRRP